jgi:hypothetical protein
LKYSPVLTTVGSTALPLSQVDYPAITICSQGKCTMSKIVFIVVKLMFFSANSNSDHV